MSEWITSDTGIQSCDPNPNSGATAEASTKSIFKNRPFRGGPAKGGGVREEPAKAAEQEDRTRPQVLSGSGFCKWFNVRMGFGFISMTNSEGSPVEPPLDVFVHQSKLVMEGFRSLKEGEQVEFTYKKSSKGLESLRVTGPGGGPCVGSERRPKGKVPLQKRKPKGDRCYNCGGLDHHAKECGLPPQPKKCHYCQSITHMMAQCPHKPLAPSALGPQDPHYHRKLEQIFAFALISLSTSLTNQSVNKIPMRTKKKKSK
uniref:Lin-28 homolog B (C. elegans) n=1 Tax=Oryzias latipes TaxID=8090 RepID=A0A3B3HF52_ORYLA